MRPPLRGVLTGYSLRGTHGVLTAWVLTGHSLGSLSRGLTDRWSAAVYDTLQAFRLRRVMRRMRNKHHARLLIRRVTG